MKKQGGILLVKLIKNELVKIFSKKSFYIILLVIFGLIIFQSIDKDIFYFEDDSTELGKEIYSVGISMSGINTSSYSGSLDFAKTQIKYDLLQNISDTYGAESWQAYVILRNEEFKAFDIFYDYYLMQNLEEELKYFDFNLKDEDKISETQKKQIVSDFEKLRKIFDSNDWREFATIHLSYLSKEKQNLENMFSNYDKDIQNQIHNIETNIEIVNIRLDKNIPFGYNFLNDAITNYKDSKNAMYSIDISGEKNYETKKQYNQLLEIFERSKYIIENQEDIENKDTSRYKLASTFEKSNQQLFIIAIIIYISANIVSEEIHTGTIKQLLTKQNKRWEILFSKLVACFIIIVLSSIIIPIMVFLANILFNETESLNIPMLIYNFNTNTLMEMSMVKYLIIQFLSKLPLFMIIMIIAFTFSTIFKNSIIAVLVPLFIYLAGEYFIELDSYNISTLKFLPTTNWELTDVLFGKLHVFEGLTINFSIIICFIYFILFSVISFMYFNKADIKNQ